MVTVWVLMMLKSGMPDSISLVDNIASKEQCEALAVQLTEFQTKTLGKDIWHRCASVEKQH